MPLRVSLLRLLCCATLTASQAHAQNDKSLNGWNEFRFDMTKYEVANLGIAGLTEYPGNFVTVPGRKMGKVDATTILEFSHVNSSIVLPTEEEMDIDPDNTPVSDRLRTIVVRFREPEQPCDQALSNIQTSLTNQGLRVALIKYPDPFLEIIFSTSHSEEVIRPFPDASPGCLLAIVLTKEIGRVHIPSINPPLNPTTAHPFVVQLPPKKPRPKPAAPPAPDTFLITTMFGLYIIAQKCAAAGVELTNDQVNKIQSYIKDQVTKSGMSHEDNDKYWNMATTAVAQQGQLKQEACGEVIRFFGMMAPNLLTTLTPNPFE
jgi:hypothetical protein